MGYREFFVRQFLKVLYLFLIKTKASIEITSPHSMPILNTRGVRATRFESSANILKGPFVNISRIVGISRGTSCILFT